MKKVKGAARSLIGVLKRTCPFLYGTGKKVNKKYAFLSGSPGKVIELQLPRAYSMPACFPLFFMIPVRRFYKEREIGRAHV
jgi:hypothetical protein